MKLISINIFNYRSIKHVVLKLPIQNDNSRTYGLIGINESGKSSILAAIGLKDGVIGEDGVQLPRTKDFRDKSETVWSDFEYELNPEEFEYLSELLLSSEVDVNDLDFSTLRFCFGFSADATENVLSLTLPRIGEWPETMGEEVKDKIADMFRDKVHKTILWKPTEQFLISKPINLAEFSSNPQAVSVPLANCFKLSGINEISDAISGIEGDTTELEALQDQLGESVTQHIKSVWKDHPVQIRFIINNGEINFHVRDVGGVKKSRTADQRSDGFKRFISFLLTTSAENKTGDLSNTILLLDEPETHLHPSGQMDLLEELKRLSNVKTNNIVLFATHSLHMIDGRQISRNICVDKRDDHTVLRQISDGESTLSSIAYKVFGIENIGYLNELFGRLHEIYKSGNPEDENRAKIRNFDEFLCKVKAGGNKKVFSANTHPYLGKAKSCCVATYVRNCIHHPESNNELTPSDLAKAIRGLEQIETKFKSLEIDLT